MTFNKGDICEITKKNGEVIRVTVNFVPEPGKVWIEISPFTPITTVSADRLTLVQAAETPSAPVQPIASTKQTPRYECLECGKLHSRRACPACGGTDKIDYVAPISAEDQARMNAADVRQGYLRKVTYAASRQPSVERDALPAEATKFEVERNSYAIRYFLLTPETIFYVEIEDGYPRMSRVEDADLAQQIRQAVEEEMHP